MMDDRDRAFHGLAIKRHADAAAVAGLMAMPPATVATLLAQAVATGRAIEAKGGHALTPLGRLGIEGRYSRHFAALRADPAFIAPYEAFERVNVKLKTVITDWQTIEIGGARVANTHTDKAHDEAVIDRLGAVHEEIEPILARLAAKLPRLSVYSKKLLEALEQAEDGDHEWVSDIRRESYHTVWFELHEDLLRIMGRQREE